MAACTVPRLWINTGLQLSLLQVLLHTELTSNGICDIWKIYIRKAYRNGPTGDCLKCSFLMLFARKNWHSQPQETVLIGVKLAHTCKVKLLQAFSLQSKSQQIGWSFIPTSYSVHIICNLFNYMKCILILTPQFFEVLHPFQYKVSDILSTWMHT